MSEQDEAARQAFYRQLAQEAAAPSTQDECDDPGCARHDDQGELHGDGAAEVTMTEIYDPDIPWENHPSGW
jgi:hypothetical protein